MGKQSADSKEPEYQCIYCFKTDLETDFSIEHIIPANIKGLLTLDSNVCINCNSWLGANVDHLILKVPEIVDGFKVLGFEKEYEEFIKHHYKISGKLPKGIELKNGRFVNGNIEFPYQSMAGKNFIVAESKAQDVFLKRLKRNTKLGPLGLDAKKIDKEFKQFWDKYKMVKPGERLTSETLGIDIIKRSDVPKVTVKPKIKVNPLPLIAKIAYEFYYFIAGGLFFYPENNDLRHDLVDLITVNRDNDQSLPKGMLFLREGPFHDQYQDNHIIRLDFVESTSVLRVSFFGHVQYVLITKGLSNKTVETMVKEFKIDDLKFILVKIQIRQNKKSIYLATSKGIVDYTN